MGRVESRLTWMGRLEARFHIRSPVVWYGGVILDAPDRPTGHASDSSGMYILHITSWYTHVQYKYTCAFIGIRVNPHGSGVPLWPLRPHCGHLRAGRGAGIWAAAQVPVGAPQTVGGGEGDGPDSWEDKGLS